MFSHITKKKGFTLIELIIVIAIIAIIVAAVFVALDPVKRLNDARSATANSDAAAIDKAIQLWNVENGKIPDTAFPNDLPPSGTVSLSICRTDGVANNPEATPNYPSSGCMDPDFLITANLMPKINPVAGALDGVTGFAIQYFNSAYTDITVGTTTSHQAISNVNSLWSTNAYTGIDDGVAQPTVPNTADSIASSQADNPDHQMYNMSNPNRSASNVTVWIYGRCSAAGSLTADVTIGGVQATPVSVTGINSPSSAWYSVSFNGQWTAANFTSGFQVGLQSTLPSGFNFCIIEAMYADVTG